MNQRPVTRPLGLAGKTLLLALSCAPFPALSADRPLQPALSHTSAVAHVRVQKVSAEMHDEKVRHIAVFTLCGRAEGLGATKDFEIQFAMTAQENPEAPADNESLFAAGKRCVLLLIRKNDRWELVEQLKIDDDGKLCDEGAGKDVGLETGMDADDAVQLLARKIKKPERVQNERPKPPPTARNQPWNLMRSSPLRRVWPFFPR